MTRPEPSRRFATLAIVLAMLTWALALAGAALALLAHQLLPLGLHAQRDAHAPWTVLAVGLAISAAAALVLLARAAAGSGRAAIVAGVLTVALGIALGRYEALALALTVLGLAAMLLLAVPQIDDHARWASLHRAAELPRARARKR